jgi:hypothetical protein
MLASRKHDFMGEERHPFQSYGPVLPGAADQAVSAVFQPDELSTAKPQDCPLHKKIETFHASHSTAGDGTKAFPAKK